MNAPPSTIALNKVKGTHWNGIKCQEHLGNHPEAVITQATINLNSQVWKSLENSLPKLYWVDLAEAYVTWESVSLRLLGEKKRYDLRLPNRCLHKKPLVKGGTGKENRYWFMYQVPVSVFLWENAWCVPETWGRTYDVLPWSTKGVRNWDEKLDSRAAKKGAKKLVSSECAKILDKENSN